MSRGGIKLQAALDQFKINVSGKVVLDVGSSTGGFVDCLLQNGAGKVYAIDTAYGELAWKLRNDPRVVVVERTNILHLAHLPGFSPDYTRDKKAHLEGEDVKVDSGEVDLITIDVGWTKLELVLPVVKKFLKPGGFIIALLKPQYEAEKKILRKGIVPKDLVSGIKYQVIEEIEKLDFKVEKEIDSPILGGGGNKEYLLCIQN